MPSIFEQQIREAVHSLGLRKEDFHRLDQIREHKVLQDVKRHFLTDPEAVSWWQSLRYQNESAEIERAHKRLEELCPNEGKKVWFITCGEEMIFDALPTYIARVLAVFPVFEYAVVDKKLRWLIGHSCRNEVYATGEKATSQLKSLSEAS